MQLIRKHVKPMEELGRVQFEIASFATQGGSQAREVAILNEHQAALLLSLMRNSEKVIDFKVALVKEFFRIRDALRNRDMNLWQQMQALISKEVSSQVPLILLRSLLTRRRSLPLVTRYRYWIETRYLIALNAGVPVSGTSHPLICVAWASPSRPAFTIAARFYLRSMC